MSVNDCEKHDWNGKAQKLVPKCPWCRIALLEAAARTLLNAEIDRWAAGTDRQSAEANAAHEKAHDALAALLQEKEK